MWCSCITNTHRDFEYPPHAPSHLWGYAVRVLEYSSVFLFSSAVLKSVCWLFIVFTWLFEMLNATLGFFLLLLFSMHFFICFFQYVYVVYVSLRVTSGLDLQFIRGMQRSKFYPAKTCSKHVVWWWKDACQFFSTQSETAADKGKLTVPLHQPTGADFSRSLLT